MPNIPRERPGAGADLALGIAMGLANAIGYVFVLVLSQVLGREEFGAFGSLNTVALLLAIPAGAFQVVTARHVAQRSHAGTGLPEAGLVGGTLTTVAILGSWPLVDLLHLESPAAPLLMAGGVLPMTITGVFQGVLLGEQRFGALASLYLVTALTRFVAAAVALVISASLAGVFALMLVATWLSCAWGAVLSRRNLASNGISQRTVILRDLLRSNSTLAALITLSSVDVILARHVLEDHAQSGDYAFASVFGKAVFWGTQFVALAVVPVIHGPGARLYLARAATIVSALGAVVMIVSALAPNVLVRLLGASRFASAPGLLLPFTCLGTLWALCQLWLFAEMGHGRARLGALTWAVALLEVLVVLLWSRDSAAAVLTTALVAAAVVAVAGAVDLMRPAAVIDDVSLPTTRGPADI